MRRLRAAFCWANNMSDEETLAATPGDDETLTDGTSQEVEQTVEAEAEGDDAGEQAGEEADAEGHDKPKRLSGSRREKIRNEMLRRENAELLRRLEQVERRQPAGDGAAEKDKEPQEADFNGDFFAYQQARTDWAVRKAIREETGREADQRRVHDQREAWRERVADHAERVEEAKSVIKDYDETLAKVKHINVSDEVAKEIIASDKSALLSYYLARNPEKLLALNDMTGRELAREIGRLEGSVRMPAGKHQTNAPKPLTPLRGGASPSFDPSKSSMEEYMAKRRAGWSG